MTLPKIDLPIHTTTLPSTGKEIQFRPFIVKEEKLLLIALENGDLKEIITTAKQVINNCLLTEGINVDKLPFFDIDYLFIAMRAKSVGETIPLKFICKNVVNGQDCNEKLNVDVDISNIKVENLDRKKTIQLTEKISIKMTYPSYAVMKSISDNETILDKKIKYIMASIDKIIDGEQVMDVNDYKKEELQSFIEGLTEQQFMKLEEYIDNFPSFSVALKKQCPKCGFNHVKRYTDFEDFFH